MISWVDNFSILLPKSNVEMLRGIADALDPLLPDKCINPTLVSSWCVMTILLSIMIAEKKKEEEEEMRKIRREEKV